MKYISKRMRKLAQFALLILLLSACGNQNDESNQNGSISGNIPSIPFEIKDTLLHDTSLFTEGFLVHNGQVFESTGSPADLIGSRSLIGISDMKTGKFEKKAELDESKFFGEGIVILNGKLYQLTYKNKTGFIYDLNSFKQIGKFSYLNKEGWGLTTNGTDLIMSDSTDKLTFLDPATFRVTKVLPVTANGIPLFEVNELEYIKGFIYANVWRTNFIVKIDPLSGKVVGKLDLSSLEFNVRLLHPGIDVLNGIAYDSNSNKIYITGKLWPYIYQLDFAR
jgi:glutaminyl-peptide cyclotransferase